MVCLWAIDSALDGAKKTAKFPNAVDSQDAELLSILGEKIDRLYKATVPSVASANGVDTPSRHGGSSGGLVGLEDMLDAVLRRAKEWAREREDLDRRLKVQSQPP